jgi:peptidoglycan/xylan/chitin deacetylase (PgdA/CDA1 family)
MTGAITLKREIKRAAGWTSVALSPLARETAGVCILMYHRIAPIGFVDQRADDWNVSPETFERQMSTLAAIAEVIPLHTLSHRLVGCRTASRPLACITIDDGYASVCTHALPILACYQLPATFFVPTAYVDSDTPLPFDRWAQLNHARVPADRWRAMSWQDLERAARTGLVTIGSHSHEHLAGRTCTPARLQEEAERSRACLRARLGPDHARTYAYPYGNSRLGDVPATYESAVRSAGYDLAVTTDPGLATSVCNPFRFPRLEMHQVDSRPVLQAKLRGSLAAYRLIDRLRPSA